jgi:hypothetical protein
MTIKDPEVIKKVQAANEARKKQYWEGQGKPEPRQVQVQKCNGCGTVIGYPGGTFRYVPARTKDGKLVKVPVHVNCPGGKK